MGAETAPDLKLAFHDLRELKVDVAYPFLLSPLHLNQGLGAIEVWNEDAIKTRAGQLADRAVGVWAAPVLEPDTLVAYRPKSDSKKPYEVGLESNRPDDELRLLIRNFLLDPANKNANDREVSRALGPPLRERRPHRYVVKLIRCGLIREGLLPRYPYIVPCEDSD